MSGLVTCRIEQVGAMRVAQVRLNRPDKLNALTLPMLHDLVATSRALRADHELRAVVLAGEGRAFCAGLDVAATFTDRAGIARAFVPHPWRGTNVFQEAVWGWRRLRVPVLAVVHGHCLGGGLQIALGADVRFTTPDARWSVLEGRWGLIPDMTGVHALSEQVGLDVAKRLTMTAESLTGAEAQRLGLATQCADDPYAAALQLVAELADRSPQAVAEAKALFDTTWSRAARRTFAQERRAQLRLLLGPDVRARLRAGRAP